MGHIGDERLNQLLRVNKILSIRENSYFNAFPLISMVLLNALVLDWSLVRMYLARGRKI